jgi:hypothetical protein
VRVDAASRELLFWVPVAACLEQRQRVKEGVVDAHRPGAASPLPAAPQVRRRERSVQANQSQKNLFEWNVT